MKIADQLKDKTIIIWGYGREGKSSEKFIKSHAKPKKIEVFEGDYEELKKKECDLILKSPGIPFFGEDERIHSQTSLFISEFREQIIGITGTKGKSTTSSMLYSVLKACGKEAILVGNIGFPCFDFYDSIQKDTWIVFEMSCHQLQRQKESPHIAVFLNLFEDHLDYYGNMEQYFEAKKQIISHQKENDFAIFGIEVPEVKSISKQILIDKNNLKFSIPMKLKGPHNLFNAAIVEYIASEIIGCKKVETQNTISSFDGLKHRLENIGVVNGVTYYNDSISTICESMIYAVESIPNAKTVLVGGMDRGISYEKVEMFILRNPSINFILMYASGKRIFCELGIARNCVYCNTLEESVKKAKEITSEGEACILSPAAASYDSFKNFEDRGEQFTKYVHQK